MEQLSTQGLAYVHVVEGNTGGTRDNMPLDHTALRTRFDGVWMVNNSSRAMAIDAVASGRADLVSFGRAFLANPALIERLAQNAVLNPRTDGDTAYGGGAHSYIDYPTLDLTEPLGGPAANKPRMAGTIVPERPGDPRPRSNQAIGHRPVLAIRRGWQNPCTVLLD